MTKILGISAYYHDSAATFVDNGNIIAAAQEERFTRIKHDPGFPIEAIKYCLEAAGCTFEELDIVIFYDKPMLKFERLLETYLANAPRGFVSFLRAMPVWLKEKLYLKTVLRNEFRSLIYAQRAASNQTTIEAEKKQEKRPDLPKLLFSEHHLSHAASAFFPSPFQKAVTLCLDGVGEWATSSAWMGEDNELKPLWEIQFPHSLGLLYSAFTFYCGFKVNSGEYKLMGLAPYGEPKYVKQIYENLVTVHEDGSFALNMDYFAYPAGQMMTNNRFHQLFSGAPRDPDKTEVSQKEMDLARSIQVVTEDIVLKIVNHAHSETGCENLCLAGGVALNCVANGRILREGPFKNIWIQPAAGDAGGSLGCALLAWYQYGEHQRRPESSDVTCDSMNGAYLGPEYSDHEICEFLDAQQLPYNTLSDTELFPTVVDWLESENVVGWFQGRMEFGPRALGNRSIIGDARSSKMQSQMNLKIKERESFRPFAPAVLAEDVARYFDIEIASPYMLLVADLQESLHNLELDDNAQGLEKLYQKRSDLPAITHVDYSARVQTVHKETNPEFYKLLSQFKEKTGTSVLINTSFNVRGEPPVCSPKDAVRCFLATEMDYLVMGNVVLDKSMQSAKKICEAKQVSFAKD